MVNQLSDKAREEVHFRVLNTLAEHPNYTQRQLSEELGVSLGRVNYCLKALLDKGLVKADRFRKSPEKRKYALVLTPAGIAERTRIAHQFLARKQFEYDALCEEIAELRLQLSERQTAGE